MPRARRASLFLGEPPHIVLVLPLPGSVNKQWRPVVRPDGKAALVKRAPAAAWMEAAQWDVLVQRGGDACPYRFAARIVLPASAMDIDATPKQLLDACEKGGAVTNDKHCRGLLVEWDEQRPAGSVLIELWALPGDPPAARPKARGARSPHKERPPVASPHRRPER